jgi:hypothetical protein
MEQEKGIFPDFSGTKVTVCVSFACKFFFIPNEGILNALAQL